MSFSRCSVGTLVLCGLLAMSATPRAQSADEGAKRIGVVNVSQIFAAYVKVKDVQDKLVNLFDADRKAIEAKGKELKKLEERLRLDPRDPKRDISFFREFQGFELQKMQLENDYQELARRVEEKRTSEMKEVLNRIKAAIRAIGTSEKFDLILRAPEFEDEFDPKATPEANKEHEDSKSAAELVRKFRENPVMYFSQGVDVTGKVITKLNDDYKAETPGK
jgi:Skp family chaperone for outer membrane proteins